MRRRYTFRTRAKAVDETRRRITEAAVELHGTVGPARTTFTGVAERAGVQRLTLYRHFPNETALFEACSAHWLSLHPPPDVASWRTIPDPALRLRTALRELYVYFDETAEMWERVYRDAPLVPALQRPFAEWLGYLDLACDTLARGWAGRGRRRAGGRAALGLALSFGAFATLRQQGADAETAAAIMYEMVSAVVSRA
jgi:AcrR family transcriptional regulator